MMFVNVITSCQSAGGAGESSGELAGNLTVAALNGPTGMGLVDLMDKENVDLQIYQAPDEAVQKLISGDVDVACLPSNMGAVLYNKTEGQVQVLTTVVNGVLYLVENGDEVNGLADLKGKTIVASGKGGTPEYVLELILESAGLKLGEDVQVKWMDAHADVAQTLMSDQGTVALLPEPLVSTVSLKSPKIRIALDINESWKELTGQALPMGILVAKKSLVEERGEDLEALLGLVGESIEEVKTASDEVVDKIVEAGFVSDSRICKGVIYNCSLTCMTAEESRAELEIFYEKLFALTPQAVGGKLPGDDLYYQ